MEKFKIPACTSNQRKKELCCNFPTQMLNKTVQNCLWSFDNQDAARECKFISVLLYWTFIKAISCRLIELNKYKKILKTLEIGQVICFKKQFSQGGNCCRLDNIGIIFKYYLGQFRLHQRLHWVNCTTNVYQMDIMRTWKLTISKFSNSTSGIALKTRMRFKANYEVVIRSISDFLWLFRK